MKGLVVHLAGGVKAAGAVGGDAKLFYGGHGVLGLDASHGVEAELTIQIRVFGVALEEVPGDGVPENIGPWGEQDSFTTRVNKRDNSHPWQRAERSQVTLTSIHVPGLSSCHGARVVGKAPVEGRSYVELNRDRGRVHHIIHTTFAEQHPTVSITSDNPPPRSMPGGRVKGGMMTKMQDTHASPSASWIGGIPKLAVTFKYTAKSWAPAFQKWCTWRIFSCGVMDKIRSWIRALIFQVMSQRA